MNLLKYIITSLILCISTFSFGLVQKTDLSREFDVANKYFQENKYNEALNIYEKLIFIDSKKSENLYYNIANTYFKTNQLGKSILYYEKTLKLNPFNTNAKHNLRLANTKIEKKLETLPELFFITWWKKLVQLFTANNWAWIAILFSWFALIAFAFYLFSKNSFLKKGGFFKIFIFGFISVLSLIIAGVSSEKIFYKEAVVLVKKTSYGKNAPSENAVKQELFNEGVKLEVIDKLEGFYKVKTTEGTTVWVVSSDFELI